MCGLWLITAIFLPQAGAQTLCDTGKKLPDNRPTAVVINSFDAQSLVWFLCLWLAANMLVQFANRLLQLEM